MTAPLSSASFLDRGACGKADPSLFTARPSGQPPGERETAAAKAICARCAVRPDCEAWATANNEPGIWGGTTEAERSGRHTARPAPKRPKNAASSRPITGALMDNPDDIAKLLLAGTTVKDTASRSGWPRQKVTALISGKPGWSLDPHTDTVKIGASGPTRAKPATKGDTAGAGQSVDQLLAAARNVGNPRINRAAEKADEAIGKLRTLYTDHVREETERREREERLAAEQKRVTELEEQLAAARAAVKELGGSPSRKVGAGPWMPGADLKAVRAWATAEGLKVAPRGRIPNDVMAQYAQAHDGVADG